MEFLGSRALHAQARRSCWRAVALQQRRTGNHDSRRAPWGRADSPSCPSAARSAASTANRGRACPRSPLRERTTVSVTWTTQVHVRSCPPS